MATSKAVSGAKALLSHIKKPYCVFPFNGSLETSKLKHEMEDKGFVLVDAPLYKKLLLFYGAKKVDMDLLESGTIHAKVARDPIPVMEHRQIAFHRMLIEHNDDHDLDTRKSLAYPEVPCIPGSPCFNSKTAPTRTRGVLQLQAKEIASSANEGSKLNFKRSGTRRWCLPPKEYAAESSVPQAMAALNSCFNPEKHQPQGNLSHEHKDTINDQVLVRIHRMPGTDDDFSPTPEGIHQDNTELTSVTMIGLHGVKTGGESRLWSLDTPTGNYAEDYFQAIKDTLVDNLLLDHTLRDPWETLLFNDRMVKHEARAFDGKRPCHRDVIVSFVRKPLKDGTDLKIVNNTIVPI